MSSHRSFISAGTTRGWSVALLIFSLSMLVTLPCKGQDNARPVQSLELTKSVAIDADASHRYHLPRSNNHSIYFLPGSAELGESARQVLADTAARLNALPQLVVALEPYSDELEDNDYGFDLRKARVEVIVSALEEMHISKHRIVSTARPDKEQASSSCTSEYCRQSYRRVRIEFLRISGH